MAIYIDANATTSLDPRVEESMRQHASVLYGNPSSPHEPGRLARTALDNARQTIISRLGLGRCSLVFTSGATEANNLAVHSLHQRIQEDRTFLVGATEHPSVLAPCIDLRSKGRDVEILPVLKSGMIDFDTLQKRVKSGDVGAVAVMAVNNETGLIQPFRQISKFLKSRGIPYLCDITQAVGKIPLESIELGPAFLTLSSHKLRGPKGIGALVKTGNAKISPQILGGSQESTCRAGTENVFGAIGFAKAVALRIHELQPCCDGWRTLRKQFWEFLCTTYPGIQSNTPLVENASVENTLNVMFPGISSEALLVRLDLEGIYISTGSACASGSSDPSHVLLAMGNSRDHARSSVRFSFCPETQPNDLEQIVDVLGRVLPEMKRLNRKSNRRNE
ncbi:MAG: cysteine desulfurase family protein [Planctomycetota bacterium]|jgi:cysteine desulfurase|nr:cysteine desulfurase family protein [Planctomycetota bacterium]